MKNSLPKSALPHIEAALAARLDKVDRRMEADTSCPALPDHEERLGAILQDRHRGFEELAQRASEKLQGLDAELAADEEQLRQQIAEMEAFRHKLTEWLDRLSVAAGIAPPGPT